MDNDNNYINKKNNNRSNTKPNNNHNYNASTIDNSGHNRRETYPVDEDCLAVKVMFARTKIPPKIPPNIRGWAAKSIRIVGNEDVMPTGILATHWLVVVFIETYVANVLVI